MHAWIRHLEKHWH